MASLNHIRAQHETASAASAPQSYFIKEHKERYILLAYFFIFFSLLLIPITQYQIPPLSDYPNHLARLYIILNINKDEFLDKYYYIDWQIIPNIAMDVIVPELAEPFGLLFAGKIFIFVSIILLYTGVHAISFSIYHRISVTPLVCALIIYNKVIAYGLLNYTFGIGVMLWGVAAWLILREKPPLLRAAVSLLFVLATFFSHIAAFGLYALGVLATELYKNFGSCEAVRRRTLVDVAVLCVPFAVVPLLMAVSPTGQHIGTVSWVSSGCTSGSLSCYFSVKTKGIRWVFETYSKTNDLIAITLILLGAFWMWRRHWLRAHPMAAWLAGVAILVYLALPTEALGSSLTDVRLPVGMALLMIGFIDLRFPNRKAQGLFVCALLGIVIMRIATVLEAWQKYDREWSEIRSSFRHIDRGSKILVAHSGALADVATVESVPCLAVIERSSLESLVFAVHGQQILRMNSLYVDNVAGYNNAPVSVDNLISVSELTMASPSEGIYSNNWRGFFDYLYVLGEDNQVAHKVPDNLQLLDSGKRYQLYRILR